MTDHPPDIGHDRGGAAHRDHHVGVGHRCDQDLPPFQEQGLFDVEDQAHRSRAGTGARGHPTQHRGGRDDRRHHMGAAATGPMRGGDRPGLEDVDLTLLDAPLHVLRSA